jgi:hypothetical protein
MLSEHLFYEIEMTFSLAALLVSTQGRGFDQVTHNARVETFPIHVRQLINFLWVEKPRYGKPCPLFASDYFAPGEWVKIRPERPDVLNEALRHKIGWGVAHLTYNRAWSTEHDKQWKPIPLACALAPAVICFADNVDHAKLNPKWPVAGMKTYTETFLERFGALNEPAA